MTMIMAMIASVIHFHLGKVNCYCYITDDDKKQQMNYIISLFQDVDSTLTKLSVSSNQETFCSSHKIGRRMTQKRVDNIRNTLAYKQQANYHSMTILALSLKYT